VDKILLVLFVAIVGSFLLPAIRLARVVERGQSRIRTDNSLQREGRETIGEIKEQIDYNPAAPFVFRPLTEEQEKEFDDWFAKHKQRMPARNPPSLACGSPAWPSAWTATARAMRATGNPVSRQLARRGQSLKK
jgi:hypothetical protein